MNYLIPIREFIVNNFNVTLKSVEKNNYKLFNTYFFNIFKIIPFFLIKNIFNTLNIKYIYLIDNIYFSNYGNFRITPILLKAFVFNDDNDNDNKINISENITNYNGTVPLWYIVKNEKLNEFQKIEFKYFSKGKMINKSFNLIEINNKLLNEIF